MEDFIFILIAIVLSVIGAFNQSKKKKAEQERLEHEEQDRSPSFFNQVLSDPLFEEEEERPVVKAPEIIQEVKTVKKEGRKPLRPTVMKKTEISDSIRTTLEPIMEEEEEIVKEKQTTRESIMNDFSLKKAIIYAEIIERKY